MRIICLFPGIRGRSFSIGGGEVAASLSCLFLLMKLEDTFGARLFSLSLLLAVLLVAIVVLLRLESFLLSPAGAFSVTYPFLIAGLISAFGISLSSHIWRYDAPSYYADTTQGVEMLLQGGVYGWTSRMLGGYPSFLDNTNNMAFVAWPFMLLFGRLAGYTLLIYVSILVFPGLMYACVRAWFPGYNCMAVWAIYLAGMLVKLWFSPGFLDRCTFNGVPAIDLYVVNLILIRRFLDKKPLSGFFLVVATAFTCYVHISYFLISLMTLVLLVFVSRGRFSYAGRVSILLGIVVLCTLHFSSFFLSYGDYLAEDGQHFVPNRHLLNPSSLARALTKTCVTIASPGKSFFFPPPSERITSEVFNVFLHLSLVPIFLWIALSKGARSFKMLLFTYVMLLFCIGVGREFSDRSFYRMFRATPVLEIIFLSAVPCAIWYSNRCCMRITQVCFVTLFLLLCFFGGRYVCPWRAPRVKSLDAYNAAFAEKLRTLDGNLVLFEIDGDWGWASKSALSRDAEAWSQPVVMAGIVAMETGKDLFSMNVGGYPPSVFRSTMIAAGTYKGRFLSEYALGDVSNDLKKWGVRYLVLWSDEARNYFKGQPKHRPKGFIRCLGHEIKSPYRRVWKIDPHELARNGFEPLHWEIYEFLDADPRGVAVFPGRGEVRRPDYFSMIVRLHGVRKGEKVVIRTNYFPAWTAEWAGRPVRLFSEDGQMALRSPADGDPVIRLAFPRNVLYSLSAWGAIAVGFVLSRKGYL
ncbi:MAG: hypothetical protein WCP22_02190 [Chlamydiota bacterium]